MDDGLDRATSHGEVLPAQSGRLPPSHKHQAPDHDLLLINEPELPELQQLGTHSVQMGPMKAILGQPPTSITLPDRFQGDEYALGPSGGPALGPTK